MDENVDHLRKAGLVLLIVRNSPNKYFTKRIIIRKVAQQIEKFEKKLKSIFSYYTNVARV